MNCVAVCAANAVSKRTTISSSTPSDAIRSALTGSGVSSAGVRSGATTVAGCGSKVSTVSAPRDHLTVADVDAVEGSDGDERGAGSASVSSIRRMRGEA